MLGYIIFDYFSLVIFLISISVLNWLSFCVNWIRFIVWMSVVLWFLLIVFKWWSWKLLFNHFLVLLLLIAALSCHMRSTLCLVYIVYLSIIRWNWIVAISIILLNSQFNMMRCLISSEIATVLSNLFFTAWLMQLIRI